MFHLAPTPQSLLITNIKFRIAFNCPNIFQVSAMELFVQSWMGPNQMRITDLIAICF